MQIYSYKLKGFSPETATDPSYRKPGQKVPSGKGLMPIAVTNAVTYSNLTKALNSKHKVRRGKSAMNNQVTTKTLKLFSTNGAGLINGRIESLKSEVKNTAATVVTVQETHCRRKGRLQMDGMVVFEAIRTKKGGGTMCAVQEELNPKLIEEYNDPFELLVVEIEVEQTDIRIITGYGPQENLEEEKRLPFFMALELEVAKAANAGKSVVIELDANSKLGAKYIPGDPHEATPNGKILSQIIERQDLVVVNGSSKCSGLITRRRRAKDKVEESIIDLVIISKDLDEELESLEIDEDRLHVLTRIKKTKKGLQRKVSDHNVLITKFKTKFTVSESIKKKETYNLKNKEAQKKFKKYTSNTNMLSSVLDSDENINIITKRLIKKINGCIAMNFKKVRINHGKKSPKEKLYEKVSKMKANNMSRNKIEEVMEEIAAIEERQYEKVSLELAKTKDGAKLDPQKFWKIRKQICPKSKDPPSAMLDGKGNILTNNKSIEDRAIEVYTKRLEGNPVKPHQKRAETLTNELCKARLETSRKNKSEPWVMEDLKNAVKDLAKDKARDALDQANELFKEEVAGDDLMLAVLKLMNMIKKRLEFPDLLQQCNITSIYKQKGSHKDFNNYRGVFRVTVLRSILDRLTYNDSYYTIDENLTDGNVGARKHRNIRDNIFIVGAISNSVINGKQTPIQITMTDVEKCFDKLWLQATINALFEAGLTCDTLNLLYIENEYAQIAVKVNGNLTKRINVKEVVMQGSVWGGLKCSTIMDKLNKVLLQEEHLKYFYMQDTNIPIGVLGMIDDTLSISKCGTEAVHKNAVINSFIENQKLTLSIDKSVAIHVGNTRKCEERCPRLYVHDQPMKVARSTRYLGDNISETGNVKLTVEARRNIGWGKVNQILGTISEIPYGPYRVQIGLQLRESILVNGMLFNSEAWSSISNKELVRMEQVDYSLLRALQGGGHSKCGTEFLLLEFGVMKLRHTIMKRRMMFHHHILTRNENETIKKIYLKQMKTHCKGDWYRTLLEDFEFIKEEKNDEEIVKMNKYCYKKKVYAKIEKAAFLSYIERKENKLEKLDKIEYKKLETQQYLNSKYFGKKEVQLMSLLRSKCHQSKDNFRKMNKKNMKCSLGCNSIETQNHIFEQCVPVIDQLRLKESINLDKIYGTLEEQKSIIQSLIQIDECRKQLIEKRSQL